MSSRIVRRAFAPAFVVTVATTATSFAETPKKAPPGTNPPTPPTLPTREPAKLDQRWHVTRTPADPKATPPRAEQCRAAIHVECPKPEAGKPVRTCNPPAPINYACPAHVKDASFVVTLSKGATVCYVDEPPMKCDPGDKCNPPPPRKVACPQ